MNPRSTLKREWITVHDPSMPVDLAGTVGLRTAFKSEGRQFAYRAAFKLEVKEPVSAVEVRFIAFDVWGSHVRNLSFTTIEDLAPGKPSEHVGEWSIYPENAVEEHYASIAYVARVRTRSGKVVEAQNSAIVEEAKRLSEKFSPADLEPPKPEKK